jgi:Family of unknown function (DUF6279)
MITIESGEAVVMMSSLRDRFARWRWIIGAALGLALAGCSVLRIAYSQAPALAYWWIDGYVDLDGEQSVELREGIDRWFDWHRRVELPRYGALLSRAQREVMEPALSSEQLCAWRDEAQRRLDAALDGATPAFATLMLSLTPEQIRHIERKMAKDGEELKHDFAQTDKAERAKASFKRTLARYENLYGKLEEPQRAKLAQLLAASPFDAERWLAERERRNRDLIALLTTVSTAGRDGDAGKAQAQAQAAVRVLAERALRSPRPDYRAYQERLTQANCALAAAMHNATTPAQRQYARDKLKGWENDVRLMIAGNGNGNDNGNGAVAPAPMAPSAR